MKKAFFILLLFQINIGFAQYTAIPDEGFEQSLILLGIDSDGILNGQVLTSDVNQLTQLNLSLYPISNMQGIEAFVALEELHVGGHQFLTSLDLSNNINLKKLFCNQNNLENLNVSNLYFLEELDCSYNLLTTIDLTNNILLKEFLCYNNSLTELNVSTNINLMQLGCWSNNLSSLDVHNNINLDFLDFSDNNISSIDVSLNNALKILGCGYNQLTSLNLVNNINLRSLFCNNNQISYLNLNNNPLNPDGNFYFQGYLYCSNNNLSELYIQNGNNSSLNGSGPQPYPYTETRFNATNNPNLHCIFVDDVANCTANWLGVDTTSHFVATQAECDALSNEEFSSNEISVYPNPVKDILYINNQNETIEEIVVYDLLGKKIVEQKTNNNQINLFELTSGFYVVKIKTESGFQTQKIVKQ